MKFKVTVGSLVLALIVGWGVYSFSHSQAKARFSQEATSIGGIFKSFLRSIGKAKAARALSPENMDFDLASGRADFIRFLYFLAVGPSSDYTISGPEGGLAGVINTITGSNGLGGGLIQAGYSSCTDIPLSGSCSATSGADTYTMSFASPSSTLTVPSTFGSSAGASFSRHIDILKNGTAFMDFDMICSDTIKTGKILMTPSGDRNFETYFQNDSSTNASYLYFFMTYPSSSNGEKFALYFQTTDGNEYKMWMVRSTTDSSNQFFVGVHGKRSLSLAHLRMHIGSTSNTTQITSSTFEECLDLTTNAVSTACTTNSIAVTDPSAGPKIPLTASSGFTFNIANTVNMSLSSLQ